jgi:hypothetical protein
MNRIRKAIKQLCNVGFQPASSCSIEGWGAALAAGALVAGVAGSAISSSAQAGAAQTAANAQETAAAGQLSLDSNVFNAQGAMSLPTREVGGEAQSREAYLLGLDPNLNISADFSTPNITTSPNGGSSTLGWNGPLGSGSQPNASAMYGFAPTAATTTTAAPATSTGMGALGGSGLPISTSNPMGTQVGPLQGAQVQGTAAPAATSAAPAAAGAASSTGTPNPNAVLGSSAYGSFANPYNPSTFYQDPGYQFIQQQGQQAISNQQATTGMALSPAALQASLGYTTGLASQEFNNAYNRSMNTQTTQLNELNALSSGGQIATSGLSTAASNLGTAGSSAIAGYGNAAAAGAVGGANALSSGINGATNSIGGALNYAAMTSGGYSTPYTPATNFSNGNTMNTGTAGSTGNYVINTPN